MFKRLMQIGVSGQTNPWLEVAERASETEIWGGQWNLQEARMAFVFFLQYRAIL